MGLYLNFMLSAHGPRDFKLLCLCFHPHSSPALTRLVCLLCCENAQSSFSQRLHLDSLRQKQCHSNRKLQTLRNSPQNVPSHHTASPCAHKLTISMTCKVCKKAKPVQAYSKTQLLKAQPSCIFSFISISRISLSSFWIQFPSRNYVPRTVDHS